MNKRKTISIVSIVLVLAVAFGLAFTNAKYTSTVNGQATASVAQYVFDVTGSDSYDSENTLGNLVLADTCDEDTLINGKIAPGTSGSFEIVVDTTGAEVGIYYEISFESASNNALPTNLVLTLDGEDWTFEDGISGTIDADANGENQVVSHTVSWSWAYSIDDNGDIADTTDGINSFDYSYTINAVGTQVTPVQM